MESIWSEIERTLVGLYRLPHNRIELERKRTSPEARYREQFPQHIPIPFVRIETVWVLELPAGEAITGYSGPGSPQKLFANLPLTAQGNRMLVGKARQVLIGLAFAGCATTMSAEDEANAARVRITNDREVARDCTFVGMASANNEKDLQRKAAWLGGDVAVITIESQEARASTSWFCSVRSTTEVFRCEAHGERARRH